MKKPTQKQVRKRYIKTGLKMAHAKRKVKQVLVEKSDEFWDENVKVRADEARLSTPSRREVLDTVRELDSYQTYLRQERGNGLTFGDY